MIKINYVKKWANDGTCYNQTIKIDRSMYNNFREYIKKLKNRKDKSRWLDSLESINSYEQNKIDNLYVEIEKSIFDNYNVYFMTLTELNCFTHFWKHEFCKTPTKTPENDYFFNRLLWRNTCIEII